MRRRLTSEMRRMSGKPIKQADEAFPERDLEKKKIKKKKRKLNKGQAIYWQLVNPEKQKIYGTLIEFTNQSQKEQMIDGELVVPEKQFEV